MGYETECEEEVLLAADSIHGAVVDDITVREVTAKATGKVSHWLNFKFRITRPGFGYDQDIVGKVVYGEISAKMSTWPGNRYREWAEALLGQTITAGSRVDIDDLIGLPCDVIIGHKPGFKDPSLIFERVVGVIPPSDPSAAPDPYRSQSFQGRTDEPPF